MSKYMEMYAVSRGLDRLGMERKKPRATARTYHMLDFLQPSGYWPQPYTLDQAFGLFGVMARTGHDCRGRHTWGMQGVRELLSRKPTCVGLLSVDPITSIDDLRIRFHYATLDRPTVLAVSEWRSANDFGPLGSPKLSFKHYTFASLPVAEREIQTRVAAMLSCGDRLAVSLNEYCKAATRSHGVELQVGSNGLWRFVLRYGFARSCGEWTHELARQNRQEAFLDTFFRAEKELHRLRTGGSHDAA